MPDQQELATLIAQRDALDKKIEEAEKTKKAEALATCRELIRVHNFTPAELGLKRALRKTNTVAPKYIGPGGQTWAGRGRKPVWLQEEEKYGKTAEDFRITTTNGATPKPTE